MQILSYVLVFSCFVGSFFSLISCIVLFKIKTSQPIFKWMLCNSILSMLYLFLSGFVFILKLNPDFFGQFYWYYRFYFHVYIGSCLRFTILFVQATICLIRYLTIINRPLCRVLKFFKTIIIIYFIVNLIINSHIFLSIKLSKEIIVDRTNGNKVFYMIKNTNYFQSSFGRFFEKSMALFKYIFSIGLLMVINILTFKKYNEFKGQKIRLKLTNVCKSKQISVSINKLKITRLIVYQSLFYLIGHLPLTVFVMFSLVIKPNKYLDFYKEFSFFIFSMSILSEIFICYRYNKKFRHCFLRLFNLT